MVGLRSDKYFSYTARFHEYESNGNPHLMDRKIGFFMSISLNFSIGNYENPFDIFWSLNIRYNGIELYHLHAQRLMNINGFHFFHSSLL